MNWLSWIVFAAALFAAGANALYLVLFPRGYKWWLRFVESLAIIYFGFLYLVIGMEYFNLTLYGPIFIRPGIGLILLLLAAESIYDILRRK